MAKHVEVEINTHNKISAGTTLQGDIESKGDIRLDGTLMGNLKTSGKLVIGATGKVVGEISCKNSDVEGSIEGKIKVEELLSLKASCKIQGDIITGRLAIESGAKFTGTCDMSGNRPIAENIKPKEVQK